MNPTAPSAQLPPSIPAPAAPVAVGAVGRPAAPGSADRLPVAVLGGGLSGLSAGWHLQRQGVPVVVFEAEARAGGVIGARREQGWLHEAGPNTLFEGAPAITAFVDELGLRLRRLEADPAAKKRYIVRGGRLVAMPDSPLGFVTNRLLSWRAKLGVLGEPFRRRSMADREETVADFVTRRLGREFLDYVVNPFVAGVHAGDPCRLSVRQAFPKLHALEQEHGSLIRGAIKRRNPSGAPRGGMLSFPDGLEEIPRALAQALGGSLRLGCEATTVRRTADGWEIDFQAGGIRRQERCAAVVCTLPADVLARLRFEGLPAAARLAELREIEHPPVASVFTGFRREDVAHPLDGFGLLVPEVEQRRILGTLFSSTLFPGRAPAGHVALTTFVGGVRQPELARLDEGALLGLVREELAALLGVRGEPAFVSVRRWPRAIPQYNLGFQRFKDACAAVESAAPGLFIGGNCRDGISLANCIESGRRLALAVDSA